MQLIYLGLGSNLGNKEKNIEAAYNKIEERIGNITSKSALYITEPIGFSSSNFFANTVCAVNTELDVYDLLRQTQLIEKEIGRTNKSVHGVYNDRLIDIDILVAGSLVIDSHSLTIPHPLLHNRKFVLEPFAEIAPDVLHPIFQKTIKELLLSLK